MRNSEPRRPCQQKAGILARDEPQVQTSLHRGGSCLDGSIFRVRGVLLPAVPVRPLAFLAHFHSYFVVNRKCRGDHAAGAGDKENFS